MTVPVPIFAIEDWLVVWVFPTIMALVFGVFVRDRDLVAGGDPRPVLQRFLSNFVVFASIWIPFQVISDAVERGAEAQGFNPPAAWGFGMGLASGIAVFLALMAVSARVKPVHKWLGYNRNPFKSAGKS